MLEVLTAVAVMEQTVSPERVVDRDLRSEPLECLRADASIVDAVEQSGPSDLVLVSSTWRQITGAPPSSPAHGCDASRPVPGSDSRSGDKGRCRHGSGEGADAERPAELRTPRLDAPGFASGSADFSRECPTEADCLLLVERHRLEELPSSRLVEGDDQSSQRRLEAQGFEDLIGGDVGRFSRLSAARRLSASSYQACSSAPSPSTLAIRR
jgi:hypothetical protein